MKCSRCGEECKETQTFCLKCGNPIQSMANFDRMEEELASNVGRIMNSPDDDDDFITDFGFEEVMPEREVEAELSVDEIKDFNKTKNLNVDFHEDIYQIDGTDINNIDEIKVPDEEYDDYDDLDDDFDEDEIIEEMAFKKKAVFLGIIAVLIVGVLIFCFIKFGKSNSVSEFDKIYGKGSDAYTAKNYDEALNYYLDAKSIAKTDTDKIKVDKAILAVYQNQNDTENLKIEILKDLITLLPKEYDYYEQLVSIYDNLGMIEEITSLIDGITDDTIKANLTEYITTVPKFSEQEGTYDHNLSIKIISAYDELYYTLDGSTPSKTSTKYTSEIVINTEGKTTIKAISYNEKGIASKVAEVTYEIKFSYVVPPVVSPAGGEYDADTEITVEVPEGMKCYYTYSAEGSEPTTADTAYDGPVKMLRGKNIFSAILVNAEGKESEPTQVIYKLNIEAQIEYSDALVLIGNYITENGIAAYVSEDSYVKDNGNMIYLSYDSIATIEENEYYVIAGLEKDATEQLSDYVLYGVNTVTGDLKILELDPLTTDQYKIKGE